MTELHRGGITPAVTLRLTPHLEKWVRYWKSPYIPYMVHVLVIRRFTSGYVHLAIKSTWEIRHQHQRRAILRPFAYFPSIFGFNLDQPSVTQPNQRTLVFVVSVVMVSRP